MAKCPDSDLAALNESGPLLRFAAEHVKDLDPDLPLAIAEARAAAAAETWDPKISQRFWGAFARLCDLIHPVTMDCLSAGEATIDPPWWRRLFSTEKRSVAERSSSRYLGLLWLILLMILPIQLYVWTCSSLSKKIDDLLAAEKLKYAAFAQDYIKLDAEGRSMKQGEVWSPEQNARLTKIITDASSISDDFDRIDTEANFLAKISTAFSGDSYPKYPALAKDPTWIASYQYIAGRQSKTQALILHLQEKANLGSVPR
jgi:hypothetical protein